VNNDVNNRPAYPLGTAGTVPRIYDIFKAYEGMKKKK
jgi:hypothetical protein